MTRRQFLAHATTPALACASTSAATEASPLRHARQAEFVGWKLGIFLHFNMGTFTGREWATGYEDPEAFAPAKLDCRQWADAAAEAGAKYAVLTAKHTGGWCLWPSAHTSHGVQSFRRFRSGRADLVREYMEAFRSRGIKAGLYYCFPGDYAGHPKLGHPIPAGKPDLHGLPPEAREDYAGFMKKQLAELLSYGPDLFWIDQYSNRYTGKRWQEIKQFVHEKDSSCLVLANNAKNLRDSDVLSYEFPWRPELPGEDNRNPAEVSDTIQTKSRWFWLPGLGESDIQSLDQLSDRFHTCRTRGANYCLNVPPDRDGLIPLAYVQRLRELGRVTTSR